MPFGMSETYHYNKKVENRKRKKRQAKNPTYYVEANKCNCHPETCCCSPWLLKDPNDVTITPFFDYDKAQTIADRLNAATKEN